MNQKKPLSQRNNKGNKNMDSTTQRSHAKKKKRWSKKVRWTFLIVTLVLSLSILIVLLILNVQYGKVITKYQLTAKQLVGESDLDTFRQSETSEVYDVDGNLITTVKGVKDVYYLNYDEIPDYATEAMISIEDKKFRKHQGIDLSANVRAMIALIKHKGGVTQGASTITQQLARNIFLSNEVSIERKLKEIFISMEIEKKYNKNQIMEFYLNNIYFANGYYGIQAASKGYFNKDVNELSLSQIAFLCAVPNNPTIYNPLDHPDNTKKRRDRILYQMLKDKVIGNDEYQKACNEEITIVEKKEKRNNYVETYVFYCATRDLMELQGFEFRNEFKDEADRESYNEEYSQLYDQCQKSLYTEGYQIYTSIDMKKQKVLQQAVNDALADYTEKNEEGTFKLQGSAVSIDNETGKVVAIVGGRYQKSAGYTLNRAYQSFRQPGSAIKPLIVYTPSFENGYDPDDTVVDKAIKDGPSNSDGKYAGKMKLRRAVELSKNTVAWRLFEKLTPQVGLSYLLNMNFAKIDRNDYYPAAALGGFTTGTSPLEMTAAYSTLENDGVYREPTCITKILNSEGNEIVSESTSKKRIYKINATRMMTDVLTGVMKNGTGKCLRLSNMSCAGKTGTTSEKKDGWFVGYTPYYTTGVWVGYDQPQAMSELSGASFPGTIWKTYMSTIHADLTNINFTPYEKNKTQQETIEEESIENTAESVESVSSEDMNSVDEHSQEDSSADIDENSDDAWGENSQDSDWNDNDGEDYESNEQDDSQTTETIQDENKEADVSTGDELSDEDNWNSTDITKQKATPTPVAKQ